MSALKNQDQIVFEDSAFQLFFRLKDFARRVLGWYLERTGRPAKLHTFEFVDPDTDKSVYLYTSTHYSVLCIGDRRLYFDRITGKFDGFSAPASVISGGIEFRD